jgi:hypothetical protein
VGHGLLIGRGGVVVGIEDDPKVARGSECGDVAVATLSYCVVILEPLSDLRPILDTVKIPPGIADCKTFFWKKAKKAYKNA